jgi:hypothetical protein
MCYRNLDTTQNVTIISLLRIRGGKGEAVDGEINDKLIFFFIKI